MKSLTFPAFVLMLSLLCSCDSFYEKYEAIEEETICLPINMTATLIQGTETSEIVADFHYVPDTDILDHITWSNRQIHKFSYDDFGQLEILSQLKVDEKVMEEMWFTYDGRQVERIDLVKRNLDGIYLDPLDSIHLGYIVFEYERNHVSVESRYEFIQGSMEEEITWKVEYEYDNKGNIISSQAFDPRTSSIESVHMTYDASKHPLSEIQYYFNGESFINNCLSKSMVDGGYDYNYELQLNEFGYPETIHEKLGTTDTQIIRYSYIRK